ncbi:MAG: TonB family protein [Candidatus Thiodiazotropha endolucinida]|nr:energy transducer TonB [Candidatus Thiodiazotropha sp. (ex Codakia orbicularis)]
MAESKEAEERRNEQFDQPFRVSQNRTAWRLYLFCLRRAYHFQEIIPEVIQPPPPRVQPKVNLREQYLAQLLAVIEAKKTYPTVARRRNMEGKIEVSFNLSCDGKVSKLTIKGPHGLLRKAAGKAIDAAQPLPQPPSQIECPMPIHYAMAYTLEK